jgi:hypothetical protein
LEARLKAAGLSFAVFGEALAFAWRPLASQITAS